jgi:hypothetical protein
LIAGAILLWLSVPWLSVPWLSVPWLSVPWLSGVARAEDGDALVSVHNGMDDTVRLHLLVNGSPFGEGLLLRAGDELHIGAKLKDTWIVMSTASPPSELQRFTVDSAKQSVALTPSGLKTAGPPQVPPPEVPPAPAPVLTVTNESGAPITAIVEGSEVKVLEHGATWRVETRIGAAWRFLRAGSDVALHELTVSKSTHRVVIAKAAPAALTDAATTSFTVTNAYGEAIVIDGPDAAGATSRRSIAAGGTHTQTTLVGAAWTVRRASDGAEIQRIEVTKAMAPIAIQRSAATPPGGPKPPPAERPPPRPARQKIPFTTTVTAQGVWRLLSGDTEMDTDGNDMVPAELRCSLFLRDGGVYMHLWFSVAETTGNRTRFAGPRREVPIATVANGRLKAGWRVVAFDARGGSGHRFHNTTYGRQHGWIPFATHGTYWDSLTYRVDGPGRADNQVVGVRGRLTIELEVEPE